MHLAWRREGGATLWVPDVDDEQDRMATALGLTRDRDLYQMRRPLPVEHEWQIETRSFRPGTEDEQACLHVNNRAFAGHPEQGAWDLATLRGREQEEWFDPAGFLLHERDGRLAGFCWTKVHADHDPPLGEIYVIAIDPDLHGQGLGRALTLAGLHDLHARRHTPVGMLYVDAAHEPAVKLYGSLGFDVHQVDRAYVWTPTAEPTR